LAWGQACTSNEYQGRRDRKKALALRMKKAAALPKAGEIDFLPFGFEACRPVLRMVINYALQQSLIP